MKVPKITSIFLVALSSVSVLNFMLKYYTYFVLMVSSSKKNAHDVNNIAEETGEVPHPHELYVPLLTFIPTKSSVVTRPWVILTSSFIEENFIGFCMSFVTIFYLGKYLENMWGAKEFSKFILCNLIIGNLLVYGYFNIYHLFWEFKEVPPVVVTPMAVIMGFFISIKQRILSHYFLFFKGNVRIKVKYLPFLLLLTTFCLQALNEEFRISFDLALNGFFISWIYLRFFKEGTNERQSYLLPFSLSKKKSSKKNYRVKRADSSPSSSREFGSPNKSSHLETVIIKGDRSEQFALHTFFPYPLSPLVKLISGLIFNLAAKYEIIDGKTFTTDLDEEDEDDQYMFEDVDGLQSNLFDLSSLKGAQEVSPIAHTNSKLRGVWNWVMGSRVAQKSGIKTSMDNRRRQALKEFE